jgi:hypothetical protein
MKINLASRQRGVIWLVLFIFIPAALLAAYLLWKIFHWHPTYDPTHGNGDPETNLVDSAVASLHQQYGADATVSVPGLGLTGLPIDVLAYEWVYKTQTSTNLTDWTDMEVEWEEALDMVQTNHNEPQRFYRRLMMLK